MELTYNLWMVRAKHSRLEPGESGIKWKFNFKMACMQEGKLDRGRGKEDSFDVGRIDIYIYGHAVTCRSDKEG